MRWADWFLPSNVILRKWKKGTPTGPVVVEFIRRTYRQDWPGHPQKRSLRLLVLSPGARWHVTVTFPDAPKAPEATPPSKQRKDLEGLCRCIDFDHIPLLRDTVTELVLSTEGTVALPVKAEPDAESLYTSVIRRLRFYTREDPLRVRFPPLDASGKTSTRDVSEITKVRELAAGVHVVRLRGDERPYVYKEVERPQYLPEDTDILQQELRNLELLPGSEETVRLVATVSSANPYGTAEVDAGSAGTSFLRGFLLEYHPNGTLQDALGSPEPKVVQPWCRWALQIARGLDHVHRHGITHLDMKPSNIVIGADYNAVLIDIGGGGYTYEWLAPDMRDVTNPALEPFEARVQNDVWAFGMMLLQMANASRDDAG
ncbi:Protein kinase-like domain containing protein [Rhypophila sp. PSN 637]